MSKLLETETLKSQKWRGVESPNFSWTFFIDVVVKASKSQKFRKIRKKIQRRWKNPNYAKLLKLFKPSIPHKFSLFNLISTLMLLHNSANQIKNSTRNPPPSKLISNQPIILHSFHNIQISIIHPLQYNINPKIIKVLLYYYFFSCCCHQNEISMIILW